MFVRSIILFKRKPKKLSPQEEAELKARLDKLPPLVDPSYTSRYIYSRPNPLLEDGSWESRKKRRFEIRAELEAGTGLNYDVKIDFEGNWFTGFRRVETDLMVLYRRMQRNLKKYRMELVRDFMIRLWTGRLAVYELESYMATFLLAPVYKYKFYRSHGHASWALFIDDWFFTQFYSVSYLRKYSLNFGHCAIATIKQLQIDEGMLLENKASFFLDNIFYVSKLMQNCLKFFYYNRSGSWPYSGLLKRRLLGHPTLHALYSYDAGIDRKDLTEEKQKIDLNFKHLYDNSGFSFHNIVNSVVVFPNLCHFFGLVCYQFGSMLTQAYFLSLHSVYEEKRLKYPGLVQLWVHVLHYLDIIGYQGYFRVYPLSRNIYRSLTAYVFYKYFAYWAGVSYYRRMKFMKEVKVLKKFYQQKGFWLTNDYIKILALSARQVYFVDKFFFKKNLSHVLNQNLHDFVSKLVVLGFNKLKKKKKNRLVDERYYVKKYVRSDSYRECRIKEQGFVESRLDQMHWKKELVRCFFRRYYHQWKARDLMSVLKVDRAPHQDIFFFDEEEVNGG